MAEKLTIILYDRDGSPSQGYPCKVAVSTTRDVLNITGQVSDSVTGRAGSEIIVYTDRAGRAPIEVSPISAYDAAVSNDFTTALASGVVGSSDYEIPFDANVALLDASGEFRYLADIQGNEAIPVSRTDVGFSIFNLPEGEYPYPDTIQVEDEDGKRYSCINLHPTVQPGVNFSASAMQSNTCVYSFDDNSIYIPDIKVIEITATYLIKPFYILRNKPQELRIYNRASKQLVNVLPNKTLAQKLSSAILNGGLIMPGDGELAVSVSSNVSMGSIFRDVQGNALTGTIIFFPDVVIYLWAEYPNVLGEAAPMRRVKQILMPNPLHKVQQAITFVRG